MPKPKASHITQGSVPFKTLNDQDYQPGDKLRMPGQLKLVKRPLLSPSGDALYDRTDHEGVEVGGQL